MRLKLKLKVLLKLRLLDFGVIMDFPSPLSYNKINNRQKKSNKKIFAFELMRANEAQMETQNKTCSVW